MAGITSSLSIGLVTFFALFYQLALKDILFTSLGFFREIDNIGDYPYQCQRIQAPGLEGCEDMWLHEETGSLYMACSDSIDRTGWFPP
jgi:arylesterase / paraoxonase